MSPMQQPMSPDMLTAILADPRTPPPMKMAAMTALKRMQGGPQAPAMPAGAQDQQRGMPQGAPPPSPQAPMSPPQVNIPAALMSGAADANKVAGMARGGAVHHYDDGGPVSNYDPSQGPPPPSLLDSGYVPPDPSAAPVAPPVGPSPYDISPSAPNPWMAKIQALADQSQNDEPSDKDKSWALLQAGLGMLAANTGGIGHPGISAIGQGALSGMEYLQQLRKERAEKALKNASLYGTLANHADTMAEAQAKLVQAASEGGLNRDLRREEYQARLDQAKQLNLIAQGQKEALLQVAQGKADEQEARDVSTAYDRQVKAWSQNPTAIQWHDDPRFAKYGLTKPEIPTGNEPEALSDATAPVMKAKLNSVHVSTVQALQNTFLHGQNALNDIDALAPIDPTTGEATASPNLINSSGVKGALVSSLPEGAIKNVTKIVTGGADYDQAVEQLQGTLKNMSIQGIKSMSKNGSTGFGRITNTEFNAQANQVIGDMKAASSPAQRVKALQAGREFVQETLDNAKDAYLATYGPQYPNADWKHLKLPFNSYTGEILPQPMSPLDLAPKAAAVAPAAPAAPAPTDTRPPLSSFGG